MSPPEPIYRRRRDDFAAEAARLAARERRLAGLRLVAFVATLGTLLVALVGTADPRPGWLAAAAVAAAAFVVLVVRHGRLRRRRRHAEALAAVNERALARGERAWDRLAPPPPPPDPETVGPLPAFARDLSLFGRASLAQLLDTAGTAPGRALRDRWLLEPAAPAEVRRRQAAAAALAPELDFRQELEARARAAGGDSPRLESFYAWAEGSPWLLGRPAILWAARLLAVLVPATLVAHLAGWIAHPWWIPAIGAAYLLSASCARRLDPIFDRVSAGGDDLAGFGALFEHLARWPSGPAALAEVGERLAPRGRPIAEWMDRLEKLARLADVRHGTIHFPLQLVTLWDFHVVARLEAWQRDAGGAVRDWLDAVAEAEALAALAALAHLHPEWTFPRLSEANGEPAGEVGPPVAAHALGHPLLPPARRIDNDLELGAPGTFLLVTGSNMAGKTTFLRALGANVVLAQGGAPVCARTFRLPPLALATSVVVEDSLEEGVSFFLAELARLKEVVDLAADPPPGRRVLYLLDEILRGTNSAERRIAVGRVLSHLVSLGAIGAVTTHDLEILATGELEAAADLVHFRETVHPRGEDDGGGTTMSFDYRARPGLAPTTNALALLEAVGLPGAAAGEGTANVETTAAAGEAVPDVPARPATAGPGGKS